MACSSAGAFEMSGETRTLLREVSSRTSLTLVGPTPAPFSLPMLAKEEAGEKSEAAPPVTPAAPRTVFRLRRLLVPLR